MERLSSPAQRRSLHKAQMLHDRGWASRLFGAKAQRLSDSEADPLPLAIDTDWVFPWTTTWMLPLVLY
jgi:hypothetical protein